MKHFSCSINKFVKNHSKDSALFTNFLIHKELYNLLIQNFYFQTFAGSSDFLNFEAYLVSNVTLSNFFLSLMKNILVKNMYVNESKYGSI